jgi:hypothetical protein
MNINADSKGIEEESVMVEGSMKYRTFLGGTN